MKQVAAEPGKVVLQQEYAEELRVSNLPKRVPGQHHDEERGNPWQRKSFESHLPTSLAGGKQENDGAPQQWRHRSFG